MPLAPEIDSTAATSAAEESLFCHRLFNRGMSVAGCATMIKTECRKSRLDVCYIGLHAHTQTQSPTPPHTHLHTHTPTHNYTHIRVLEHTHTRARADVFRRFTGATHVPKINALLL